MIHDLLSRVNSVTFYRDFNCSYSISEYFSDLTKYSIWNVSEVILIKQSVHITEESKLNLSLKKWNSVA